MALAISVGAQESKFGAKTGLSSAKFYDGERTPDLKTGFYIGAFYNHSLSEKFSVQPEIIFSQQGAKESGKGIDMELRANVMNIPLLAKYNIVDGLSVLAGPQLGILLSADLEAKVNGDTNTEDYKDKMKGLDFSTNVGLEYLHTSGVGISASYIYGLSRVFKNSDSKEKNSVFQIGVIYRF